jgi:hypothetical protein
MDAHSDRFELSIRTPCPKRWEELSGDGRRRFCSECSLHVHNAAELTQREARALVEEATGRVCMRIEYDADGAAVHRPTRVARFARWALTSGAALLAACQGGRDPAPAPQPVEPPSTMGKVAAPQVLGDVAAPPVEPAQTPVPLRKSTMGGIGDPVPPPVERLGEAAPTPAPGPTQPK